MSRAPDQPAENVDTAGFIFDITSDSNDWLYTMQIQDVKLREIIAIYQGKQNHHENQKLKKIFAYKIIGSTAKTKMG